MLNYNKVIELDPKDAEAYFNKAILYKDKYYKHKDLNKVVENLDMAIDIDPALAKAYYNKALLYQDEEYKVDLQQARVYYEKAIKYNPEYVLAYIQLAKLLENPDYDARNLEQSMKNKQKYLDLVMSNIKTKMDMKQRRYKIGDDMVGNTVKEIEESKKNFDGVYKQIAGKLNNESLTKNLIQANNGRYVFHENSNLGKGSFGLVKLAGDIDSDNLVAMKIIQRSRLTLDDQSTSLSLIDEVEKMSYVSSINSPFLIKLIDYFEDQQTINIVTEFCNQGELKDLINQKKSSWSKEDILKMLFNIVLGLCD